MMQERLDFCKKLKGISLVTVCLLTIGGLSGCIIRTYSVVKDRVDQDLQGNNGYIQGTAPASEEIIARKKTRQVEVVEIELRSPIEIQAAKASTQDSELTSGNRGYVTGSVQATTEESDLNTLPMVTAPAFDTYKVQKDDTLEKIAAKKEVYGNYKKWKKIYEANKDKLKGPNKIYPGQLLDIPRD